MEEKQNEYTVGGNERLRVVSEKSINWMKLYKVEYDSDKNIFIWDKEELCTNLFLQPKEAVYFKLTIPEGIPTLGIKFERSDYIQGSFLIGYHGKTGGMHPVEHQLH